MKNKWTMEQILHSQNIRAKAKGATHDLTMVQWIETLEYFHNSCAYCGGAFEVIEHYLPCEIEGTTVSNCVPSCKRCNYQKDKAGHNLFFYQNSAVLDFIKSKGVEISFHIHNYEARFENGSFNAYCLDCSINSILLGCASMKAAEEYIKTNLSNAGYAYKKASI